MSAKKITEAPREPLFDRLPESVQTLYAELLELSIQAAATAGMEGSAPGSFVRKQVKGRTYWYWQRLEGERKRQHYLGPDSPALRGWMERVRGSRAAERQDADLRRRLCRMLVAGGAQRESAGTVRVLELLAEAGVFRLGGVLVGTHAFAVYGNMLGVAFDQRALRTQDVDIAQDPAIAVALAAEPVDVAEALRASELGFHAVPGLDPRHPSTSYKIRGRELRVDFLTPLRGRDSEKPVYLSSLKLSAQPLRFLDYLIQDPVEAVAIGGREVLVNVPDPARFLWHKLWISQRREAAWQTKAAKDLRQAAQLAAVLLADRPEDLRAARQALPRSASLQKAIAGALERLAGDLRERLLQARE